MSDPMIRFLTTSEALKAVSSLMEARSARPLILALDGRCAAGKTTFAKALSEAFGGAVIHMDDFFLPSALRTPERFSELAGNIHRERLLSEVLVPLKAGKPVIYRPYVCGNADFGEEIALDPKEIPLVIVEGSYACHPELLPFYDLRLFLTVEKDEQEKRVLARNGDGASAFFERWIPMEERYNAAFFEDTPYDLVFSLRDV